MLLHRACFIWVQPPTNRHFCLNCCFLWCLRTCWFLSVLHSSICGVFCLTDNSFSVICVCLGQNTCAPLPVTCPPVLLACQPGHWIKINKIWLIWNVGYHRWLFLLCWMNRTWVERCFFFFILRVLKLQLWPKTQHTKIHTCYLWSIFNRCLCVVLSLHLTSQKMV